MFGRKTNPPIAGHHLLNECLLDAHDPGYYPVGCECGARPSGVPYISIAAIKRWHRKHKDDVRLALAQRGRFTAVDRSV